MKKKMSLFIVLTLVLGLCACGKSETPVPAVSTATDEAAESSEDSANAPESSESEDTADSVPDEPEQEPTAEYEPLTVGEFSEDAAIEETVLHDADGITVTALGLRYDDLYVHLDLRLENNSGQGVYLANETGRYTCFAVNGYMLADEGAIDCSAGAGETAEGSMDFQKESMTAFGISKIADLAFGLTIFGDDYSETDVGVVRLTTSAGSGYDYGRDTYSQIISMPEAMDKFGYKMYHFSQSADYDVNGVKVLSTCVTTNFYNEPSLRVEVENTNDTAILLRTGDIEAEGLGTSGGTWSSDIVLPHSRFITNVNLSYALGLDQWDGFDPETMGAAALSLSLYDLEGNNLADYQPVKII